MEITNNEILRAALSYREQGFSVIPLRPGDKRPLIEWAPYQQSRATEEQVRKWWAENPEANVGIVTGPVSGIDVIDLDGQEGIQNFANWVNEQGLKVTENGDKPIVVKTPSGGQHVYIPAQGRGNATGMLPKVDYRGKGGYVVAPPSVLSDGREYAFHGPCAQQTRSLKSFISIGLNLEFKTKFLQKLYNNSVSLDGTELCNNSVRVYTGTEKGVRDDTLFHMANRLVFAGTPDDEVLFYLLEMNKNMNPPLSEKEVLRKLESANKHADRRIEKGDKRRQVGDTVETEGDKWRQRETMPCYQVVTATMDDVRDLIESYTGEFSNKQVYDDLNVRDKTERRKIRKYLSRLKEDGIIRQDNRKGFYRKIDLTLIKMDLTAPVGNPLDICLPFELVEKKGIDIMEGNVIVIAGEPNVGKTTLLMNLAFHNIQKGWKVNYFNSEMGRNEFRKRIDLFGEPLEAWRYGTYFNVFNRSSDFADAVGQSNNADTINIIDFLEEHEEFYKMGSYINDLHLNAGDSVVVAAIQKKPGTDIGRGGVGTLEKPRLYLSLSFPEDDEGRQCMIRKAKNIADGFPNPNGTIIKYGCNGSDIWVYDEELYIPNKNVIPESKSGKQSDFFATA